MPSRKPAIADHSKLRTTRAHRLARLIEMITLVQSGDDWTPRRLAEHFGISETRIYHDVKELCLAGVPISYSGSGYSIDQSFFLPALNLSPEEALLLLFPETLFRQDSVKAAHERIRAKILSIMPDRMRKLAKESLERTDIRVGATVRRDQTFERIHEAVAERRRVFISYRSIRADDYEQRMLDPYGLAYRRNAWYVVGLCHKTGEVRTFKLSRVRNVAPTEIHFQYPEGFSVKDHFAGRWNVYDGEEQEVVIRFSPLAARLVQDNPPFADGKLIELSDGSAIFRGRVRGVQEIGWWIMKYGEHAEVMRPPELREQIAETVRKMAAVYRLAQPVAAETEEPYGK